jgi:glycosyltransferase involved in cell wall biosynthesis
MRNKDDGRCFSIGGQAMMGDRAVLISVIIPVYNTVNYVDECIESVVSQEYRNLEIILIDDGSTDGSGGKCDAWKEKDSRIHVIHQKNMGVSAARNNALGYAQGSYICFVDSDDWLEAGYVGGMLASADGSGTDLIMCDVYDIAVSGKKCRERLKNLKDEYSKEGIYRAVLGNSWIIANKLIGAKCIGEVRFPEYIRYGEDGLFLHKIAAQVNCLKIVKRALYNYRIEREGNVVSEKLNEKHLDFIRVTQEIAEELLNKKHIDEGVYRIMICYKKIIRASKDNNRLDEPYHGALKNLLRIGARHAHLGKIGNLGKYSAASQTAWIVLYRIGLYDVNLARKIFLFGKGMKASVGEMFRGEYPL